MSYSLPFSAAIVVTSGRVVADRLRQQLNQIGIPFVHTPTDQAHARQLLDDDEEAILLVDCDGLGGTCHLLLEDLSFHGQSRLRPVIILVDEACPELKSMVNEFEFGELISNIEGDLESCIENIASRSLSSFSLREKYRAARFLRNKEQLSDAGDLLLELIDILPDCSSIVVELADLFRQQGRYDEAVAILREAVEASENALPAWQGIAQNYHEKQRWSLAIEAWEKALSLNPYHYLRMTKLAEAYLAFDQLSQAETAFKNVLQMRREHQPAIIGLLQSGLLAEHYSELASQVELLSKPALVASQCNKVAFTLMAESKWEQAMRVLYFAMVQLQDDAQLLAKMAFNLGIIFHKQDCIGSAVTCFGLASVIDPQFEKAKANWQSAAEMMALPELPAPSEAIRSLLTGEPLSLSLSWSAACQEVCVAPRNP